jgi:hypothetical protein
VPADRVLEKRKGGRKGESGGECGCSFYSALAPNVHGRKEDETKENEGTRVF